MNRVIILFGFCTAGKSTILRVLKENLFKDGIDIKDIDTDKRISEKKYGGHIYNIYEKLYENEGDGEKNIKVALDYIKNEEEKLLEKLAIECSESKIPFIIAPGPFLVIRKPQWSDFCKTVNPVCYYLTLTPNEVYEGLINRRNKQLEFSEISKSECFGCWDVGVTTHYVNGKYEELPKKQALENISNNMGVCKKFEELSIEISDIKRTFKAREIQKEINDGNFKNELYKSIKSVLSMPL